MSTNLGYVIEKGKGEVLEIGEATANLSKKEITLETDSGKTFDFRYKNILEIECRDYKIHIETIDNVFIELKDLGYSYEVFCKKLLNNRNQELMDLLLMNESQRSGGFEAEFIYNLKKDDEEVNKRGKCLLRLYETGLVVLPKESDVFRVPLGDVVNLNQKDYVSEIKTGVGETLTLKKMGRRHKEFIKEIKEALNELNKKTQNKLKEIIVNQEISGMDYSLVSEEMRDGKAVSKKKIKEISPRLCGALFSSLKETDLGNRIDYLTSLTDLNDIYLGVKEDLMGDLTETYIWFLVPILKKQNTSFGNAFVMESGNLKGEGKATYVFQAMDQDKYKDKQNSDLKELRKEANEFVKKTNRCMMDINFRREPIYLTEKKLKEKRYRKYNYAIKNLPSLRYLRKNYIGRVIHRSKKQWRKDLKNKLKEPIN